MLTLGTHARHHDLGEGPSVLVAGAAGDPPRLLSEDLGVWEGDTVGRVTPLQGVLEAGVDRAAAAEVYLITGEIAHGGSGSLEMQIERMKDAMDNRNTCESHKLILMTTRMRMRKKSSTGQTRHTS